MLIDIQPLINHLTTNNTFIDELIGIARLSEEGYIINEKQYAGITDKKGNFGYIRYAGDTDGNIEELENPYTSEKNQYQNVSILKLVLSHRCENVNIVHKLVSDLFSYKGVTVISYDEDVQRILSEETKQESDGWNDSVKLISIDFEYKTILNNCPTDFCCGDNC